MVKSRSFVPTVVVAGLVLLVLLGSQLAGRPPVVDAITPTAGKPGDVMILTGRYFGKERGEVRISGISPTSSDYSEWTETRISVAIPEEATSGLVYVITANGRSRGLLFTNREEIPIVAAGGPATPGEPWISGLEPLAARVGDTITIRGMNFGLERGGAQVYFAWAGGTAAAGAGGTDLAQLTPARDADLDYVAWSDREIVVRVPDGAASGNLLVAAGAARSNSQYFEVLGGAGLKFLSNPRTISVQYGFDVGGITATADGRLYLWLPRPLVIPEQRGVRLVAQDPEPLVVDHNDTALFQLSDLARANSVAVRLGFMIERYQVETQVTASKVPATDDAVHDVVARFTAADPLVPSTATDITKAVATVVRGEKNPYLKARKLYDWLLGQLSYAAGLKEGDAVTALRDKRGDAFSYASLYCALLRAAGVPARMAAGVIVGEPGQPTIRHFWDEVYVATFGWIPVDPLLGDEPLVRGLPPDTDVDRKLFYFGSLDNRHLTFSKGLEQISALSPDGRTTWRRELPWLLTVHEEAAGGLASYTAAFRDPEVTGIY